MPSAKPAANQLTIFCTASRGRPSGLLGGRQQSRRELNWRVTRTLDEMAQDTWPGSHAIHRDIPIKERP